MEDNEKKMVWVIGRNINHILCEKYEYKNNYKKQQKNYEKASSKLSCSFTHKHFLI